jgi:ABC-type branched-subunit amino acid transport system substrate-binding protein
MKAARRWRILLAPAALAAVAGTVLGATTIGNAATPLPAIKIATAAPLSSPAYQIPQYKAGLEAAMAAINAAGGVKGRKLTLSVCDTKFTANGEVACARAIVAAKPAVSVAPFLVADGTGAAWPILLKAGIPAIGQQGGSAVEMNSANVFPLGSAFMGPFVGMAEAIERSGAKKIVLLRDDPNPAGPIISQLITGGLNARGITDVRDVVGSTASDPTFATAAAQATSGGTDGIVINAAPQNVATIVKALRAGGYNETIAVPSLLFPPQVIQALGSAAEGVIVDSALRFVNDTGNAGIALYLAQMKKYQPKAVIDDASLQGWSAMHLFAKAAAGAKRFDKAGLMAAFRKVTKPINVGTAGPWSVVGKLRKIPGFSRIVNPTVVFGTVRGGRVAPMAGGFVNPFIP